MPTPISPTNFIVSLPQPLPSKELQSLVQQYLLADDELWLLAVFSAYVYCQADIQHEPKVAKQMQEGCLIALRNLPKMLANIKRDIEREKELGICKVASAEELFYKVHPRYSRSKTYDR